MGRNCEQKLLADGTSSGRSNISGKGVHLYKGVGVHFADFISFSQISHENEIISSHWDQIISFS